MPDGMKSDSPPPYKVPNATAGHDVLAQCAGAFAGIDATLRMVGREVRGVRDDIEIISKSQAALEQSTRGLWHEVRDELKPTVGNLPDRIGRAVRDHAGECPARRKAMKRAESDSGDKLDVRAYREDQTGAVQIEATGNRFIRNSSNGHYEIPRPVLWTGALIGAAVAASGYVIQLLSNL